MKILLRPKKTFELARKSALKRSAKEKALYLTMTNGKDKHYICKMPNDLTIIHTLDGREKRLKEIKQPEKPAIAKKKIAKKKKKVKK